MRPKYFQNLKLHRSIRSGPIYQSKMRILVNESLYFFPNRKYQNFKVVKMLKFQQVYYFRMRKCVLQILKLICVPGTIKAGEIYLAIKISFSELISAFFGTSSQVKNYIKFTFFDLFKCSKIDFRLWSKCFWLLKLHKLF